MRRVLVMAVSFVAAATMVPGTRSIDARGQAASTAPLEGPALARLPDTSERIVPFADQLDDGYSDRIVRFVATHFAGTQKMRRAENDRFRRVNPKWFLLHYRLGASSGPVTYLHGNTWSSDWASVTQHEDWFLHNERGARHHDPQSNWFINDPDNAGFREYWVANVLADMRATGAQGVFADSFEAGVSGYGVSPPDGRFEGKNPANPAVWPDGVTWLQRKLAFIDFVRDRFSRTPERFLFVPNIGLATTWWWPKYEHIDGAMFESFPLGLSTEDWVLATNRALELSRPGKFLIDQAYPKSVEERLFLVGTYLLIKGQRTFINPAGAGAYYFPEYDLPLGPARDPLPADVSAYLWQGIYKREFRDAVVLVNPGDGDITVKLPETLSLVIPQGGGKLLESHLDRDGRYIGGTLTFRDVSQVTLKRRGAALLKRK